MGKFLIIFFVLVGLMPGVLIVKYGDLHRM